MRKRLDYEQDGSSLAELLDALRAARAAEDPLEGLREQYQAETAARRATNAAIRAGLESGLSARSIGQALGLTHAAVTARARRAARADPTNPAREGG